MTQPNTDRYNAVRYYLLIILERWAAATCHVERDDLLDDAARLNRLLMVMEMNRLAQGETT